MEDQLPPRTIKTYFVPMTLEQQRRYEEQELIVSRLAHIKRPLLEKEFEKLQASLARMRMLCDTPYILDETCRLCPKLQELKSIIKDIEQDTKVIIFSEWERMLFLVRELLEDRKIEYAWHTGSVDQKKRREVLHHFKEDPKCRVFLSTDCGGVGLNLQKAQVVINMDLPWNPAKLEQRIARAWRKNQTKRVQVINLVSEDTLEHRMLGVLKLKQSLSHAVLDSGTISLMDLPSGRKAFMDRLTKIMGSSYHWTEENPLAMFQEDVIARLKPRIHQLESYKKGSVLAVVDGDISQPKEEMQALLQKTGNALQLEVIDRQTFETLQRLSKAGIISFQESKSLYATAAHHEEKKLIRQYNDLRKRKERLAEILIKEGFFEEAPLKEVFELVLKTFAVFKGLEPDKVSLHSIEELVQKGFPKEAIPLALELGGEIAEVGEVFKKVQRITEFLESALSLER